MSHEVIEADGSVRRGRVYLAGPMRGYPRFNFDAFDKARDYAMTLGWAVISPADIDRGQGIDPDKPETFHGAEGEMKDIVERDLKALQECDAIAMLPGWERSTGACAEHAVAKFLKLPILDARTFKPLESNQGDPGLHLDDGKLRLDLIPPEADEAMAEILSYGCRKYAERNWELGMKWMRLVGSIKRHLMAWEKGQSIDSESGKPHLWHLACDVAFLLTYEMRGVGTDDRPLTTHPNPSLPAS